MVVLKFGGTSVADAPSIRRVARIVAAERRPRIVVVSALGGVTDALLHLAAGGGTIPGTPPPHALDTLLRRHTAAAQMVRDRTARAALEHECYSIAAHVAATLEAAPGRLSPRSRDEVAAAGELWSSRLLAAVLNDRGLVSAWVDARHAMRTNSHHGSAAPDLNCTRHAVTRLLGPHLASGRVVVLGGFIGSDPSGATTTLGRGGSDYSAAVFGACLDVAEIQIWTDVDGVLTADPRVVPHARPVPRLSYGEAHDLACFGAKVLHPGTIRPAVDRGIPVLVRNSHRPGAPGTVVSVRDVSAPAGPVAGLACRGGATLIEAVAPGNDDGDRFVTDVFDALHSHGIDAALADLCGTRLVFTVQDIADAESVRVSLSRIGEVRVLTGLATVSIVGEGLATDPRLTADATRALGDLPIQLVARPSGGRTLAFVVDARQASTAMSRLHDCFFGAAGRRPPLVRPAVQA
jgi:aspartate kinase